MCRSVARDRLSFEMWVKDNLYIVCFLINGFSAIKIYLIQSALNGFFKCQWVITAFSANFLKKYSIMSKIKRFIEKATKKEI